MPCGDGSAAPFVDPINEVGLVEQDEPRRVYRITEPIVVEEGDSMIAAMPMNANELRVIYDLDYGCNSDRIKRQIRTYASGNGDYQTEFARARTYSLEEEAKGLWERGMCRHLTPKDVLVIGENGPIDNEYRFEDEPVRHKIVDLLGDLYLVGCQVTRSSTCSVTCTSWAARCTAGCSPTSPATNSTSVCARKSSDRWRRPAARRRCSTAAR